MMHSGSSYLSQSELVLTFGLGQKTTVNSIEIAWPSGEVDHLTDVAADQTITVEESKGIVAERKFVKREQREEPTRPLAVRTAAKSH
jgi:hypothetical protein